MGQLKRLAAEEEPPLSEQIGKAPAELEKVLIGDWSDDNPLSATRGIVLGAVLGAILWAANLWLVL